MLIALAHKSKKSKLLKHALEMYEQQYKLVTIAKELGINVSTLRRWLRDEGAKPKKDPHGSNPSLKEDEPEEEENKDPLQKALDDDLEGKTEEAIKVAKLDARLEEDKNLMEVAQSQSYPADKYQSYIAAASIKLLRDSIKSLRGPRTVKELSELDQLIRRNLGLNAKSAGGSGKLQIDISILNNAKADRGNGAVKIEKVDEDKIIDVDPNENA
jgi:transposase-like protein